VFLGGYHLPFIPALSPEAVGLGAVLAKLAVYALKVVLLVCFAMVVRWTLPRMRYDQVMMMAWQAIIPLALIVVVVTSVMVYLDLTGLVPMLAANILVAGGLVLIYPLLPRYEPNRPIQLYGSRFRPMPGELVNTAPTDPMALEDRPVEGTDLAAGVRV
jgi:NADH-quinone oxidoreductase subunit H